MGSPVTERGRDDDEGSQHMVTISKGFWLFDTACTQALWKSVMGDNPSRFKGDLRPVDRVSWSEAERFIVLINLFVPGLDLKLPSEVQWEYACRAGTTTAFNLGDLIDPTQANYEENYPLPDGGEGVQRPQTVNVATFPPNAWGLHEMHGNVWELCEDVYHPSEKGGPDDGTVRMDRQSRRVLRGGSWKDPAADCRSARRYDFYEDLPSHDFGFRCARDQD